MEGSGDDGSKIQGVTLIDIKPQALIFHYGFWENPKRLVSLQLLLFIYTTIKIVLRAIEKPFVIS